MGRKVLASKAGTILSVKGWDRTVSVFANMVKTQTAPKILLKNLYSYSDLKNLKTVDDIETFILFKTSLF